MLGYKAGALLSSLGIFVTAQIGPLLDEGQKLGQMSALGVLGFVCVICIIGMMTVYRDRKADVDKLYALIEASTKSITETSEAIKSNTSLMVEIKDVMHSCNKT